MSIAQTARRAMQAVTGSRTKTFRMVTTYCKPVVVTDPKTGLQEQASRVHRAGQLVTVQADDPEFIELERRRCCYEVHEVRDERGRLSYEGQEPTEPPVMDPPVSSKLDPTSEQAQQQRLLERIADALDHVRLAKASA